MGTQFQRLTTQGACGPEAVQPDSAWILAAHHVFFQVRLQLLRGFLRPPRPGPDRRVWPWQSKSHPDRHRPLCPQLSPLGRPLPCCGFSAWKLRALTLTLTLPRPGTLHQHLGLPRSLTLQFCRLLALALTSASNEITRLLSFPTWPCPWTEL